ncbi:hypothetical protein ACFOHW_02570 [Paenibacillus abyssi]
MSTDSLRTHPGGKQQTCFVCEQTMAVSDKKELLCTTCSETSVFPVSHYYMMRYYYDLND